MKLHTRNIKAYSVSVQRVEVLGKVVIECRDKKTRAVLQMDHYQWAHLCREVLGRYAQSKQAAINTIERMERIMKGLEQ